MIGYTYKVVQGEKSGESFHENVSLGKMAIEKFSSAADCSHPILGLLKLYVSCIFKYGGG